MKTTKKLKISWKSFIIVTLITSLWVHAWETFRYLSFIRPSLIEDFGEGVALFDLPRFLIWGFWDTLLTGLIVFSLVLFTIVYGNNGGYRTKSIVFSWLFFFGLFWVGMYNMQLADLELTLLSIVLSFVEVVIAVIIADKLSERFSLTRD